MLKKNDIIPLNITSVTGNGQGVGRHEGMAVFVPFTAQGDEISARIVKVNKSYCFGIMEELCTPSPHRITPDCPVYGRCGGCVFRHISYENELEIKADRVAQDMKRIGKVEPHMLPIIPSPDIDRYRNKAMIPIAPDGDKIVTGFYAPRSHRVLPCGDCKLQPEEFAHITKAVVEYADICGVMPYDELTKRGILRHIFLRHAQSSGQIMVVLVVTDFDLPNKDILIQKITDAYPNISGILLNKNAEVTNVILGKQNKLLWGTELLRDELCGLKIDLSPHSFYQVNKRGAEVLYGEAARMAELSGNELVLDLYCGAGTIGLSMADKASGIVGVEIVPQAIENAKENAKNAGINNARFICADAATAAERLATEGLHPDVVLLDPPRKGCDVATIEAVCQMSPERIVMVSCDSATAARDVALFETKGYKATLCRPVDMFPRTGHVETVLLLSKLKSKSK